LHVIIRKVVESYHPAYGLEKRIEISVEKLKSRLAICLFTPVLAPLLQKAWPISILVAFGFIQLLLVYVGLGGWQCPLYSSLRVICPGCGLTTAGLLLLKGDWRSAFELHVFALPIWSVLTFMGVIGILPMKYKIKTARRVAALEKRTGIVTILLLAMILYWLVRI
jgi:hypothetical protein